MTSVIWSLKKQEKAWQKKTIFGSTFAHFWNVSHAISVAIGKVKGSKIIKFLIKYYILYNIYLTFETLGLRSLFIKDKRCGKVKSDGFAFADC